MLLSNIIGKRIFTGDVLRGVCLGVGVSLKTKAVKYLLCSANESNTSVDFAVGVSAVCDVSQSAITLSHLRPVFPKQCAKLFLSYPVYNSDGVFLGYVKDAELQAYTLVKLHTDKNEHYPFSRVTALADAVIIRKSQPYPVGQPIPDTKNEPVVTKSTLRRAIENQRLIRLTLSLAPFSLSL